MCVTVIGALSVTTSDIHLVPSEQSYTVYNKNEEATTMKNKARTFRLPETTTPEDLACNWSTTLNFGNKVLLAGYFYRHGENSYFGAVYIHTDEDLSCEGEIRLTEVSEDFFEDNGHAIAWAMAH